MNVSSIQYLWIGTRIPIASADVGVKEKKSQLDDGPLQLLLTMIIAGIIIGKETRKKSTHEYEE
jgi:hypothetical protein